MNEPIELTDADRIAAVRALTNRTDALGMAEAESRVYTVINAVNKVRAGDPVGTIRRHVGGNVAVLTEVGWIWVDVKDGYTATSHQLNEIIWSVVFQPGVS